MAVCLVLDLVGKSAPNVVESQGGTFMVGTLIAIYLIGWLPVSFAAYAAGKRLADRRSAADQPLMMVVSLAAGAIWPLLVVGLVELSSVMVLTKVPSRAKHSNIGIYA